jgi:hypothetical protein
MTPNPLCYACPIVLAALAVCCSGVAAQTENQLEQRYGHPAVFEVRPGINIYPTFAADGDVCRMVIAKHPTVDNKAADMDTTLSSAQIKEIEDELIPPEARGPELSPYFSPASFVVGESSFIQKDYENVSIGVASGSVGAVAIVITWRHRTCTR